ncbi:MAG: ABC transporter permease subunit [Rhodobacteraceae bacterium]|nr:ABC transporter permease subunit [Paracoccaceae bacterium]
MSARRSPGVWAALVTMLTGVICLALEPLAPWLIAYPTEWTLPATAWAGEMLERLLSAIKPAARVFSDLLSWPMHWANTVLGRTPWPLLIGAVTALGWYLGGWRMAILGLGGFSFVLASGYWAESMNTLALVAVSVPLALVAGGTIGILANELPRARPAIQAALDVMQTVPTFAYLTPLLLLFGFGPVVGLIASAIYAAPPMARNVILGLERVEPEIREAAVMSGSTRVQQLFLIEIPTAGTQIMVGVNQCLMAALSMVIIAAVIGSNEDIGWEVLLTMRKSQFGPAMLAGFVIVTFAIVIDRMSGALATRRSRHELRVVWAILAAAALAALAFWRVLPDPGSITLLDPVADWLDTGLTAFNKANGQALNDFKNDTMFYAFLPLRIGLDQAVLPFTWGFQWTAAMSLGLFASAAAACATLWVLGRPVAGLALLIVAGIIETGVTDLPWPFVLAGAAALGWVARGWQLALLTAVLLGTILLSGLWAPAMLSLYLSCTSVAACAVAGGALGLLCAVSPIAWRLIRPVCDMLQTIPLFVFLIPVLMFFQIGEFSAFLAICLYAVVPMIRYTRHGLVSTPPDLIEAATASGARPWQILRDIRAPYAAPAILLGLNQTILFAFAMLVIAALVGTTGLGQSIYLAIGQADLGLGVSAGAAMAILAFIADRLVQGFAEERRRALGL